MTCTKTTSSTTRGAHRHDGVATMEPPERLVAWLAKPEVSVSTCGDWATALQYGWSAGLRESLVNTHEDQPEHGWRQGAVRHNPARRRSLTVVSPQ